MYSREIKKVIEYIEANLFEELSLEELVLVAGYSKYHFARLFKEATGENIISMIKRLRLEKSAKDLFHLKTPVTQIGLDAGYWTPSSYNKAFKQKFKQSPSDFRQSTQHSFQDMATKYDLTVEIIERKPQRTISHRAMGNYNESAYVAWQGLFDALDKYQNSSQVTISTKGTNYYGLAFDLPNITDAQLLRYEACIEVPNTIEDNTLNISHREIPGGSYAIVNFKGDYNDLYDVWVWFYSQIQKKQYKLADFPPIERYLNDPGEVLKELPLQPETELLLLLKP